MPGKGVDHTLVNVFERLGDALVGAVPPHDALSLFELFVGHQEILSSGGISRLPGDGLCRSDVEGLDLVDLDRRDRGDPFEELHPERERAFGHLASFPERQPDRRAGL